MKLTDLHDWEIIRVEIEHESKSAKLHLYDPVTKKGVVIDVEGIKRFFASGMMLQNVVLDVLVFDCKSSSSYLEYCKEILELDAGLIYEDDVFLYIEPSVGIEVVCLCRSVNVLKTRTVIK